MLSPHAAPKSPVSAGKASPDSQLWSVPPLSAAASADILHFLSECSLDISRIHELEARLSSAMLETESESIAQLYHPAQQQATDRIAASIDSISEKVDELQLWLSHHDAELARMRQGIERIETKNTAIEIAERNHTALHSTLTQLIHNTTLPADVVATLQQPDFAGNMAGVMRAVQRLDGVLGVQLDAGLDELAAVKQQRAMYGALKTQFAQRVREALEQLFAQHSQPTTPSHSELNTAVLDSNAAQQAELGRYIGLAQYLARYDPDSFVALRPKYTAAFARLYDSKLQRFFHDVKKLVQAERHDSALATFPDFLPGTRPPPLATAAPLPVGVSGGERSMSVRGRQSASSAFRSALSCVMPVVLKEEQFLSQFFIAPSSSPATIPSPPTSPVAGAGAGAVPTAADGLDKGRREELRRLMAALFPQLSELLSELSTLATRMDPFYALEMEVAVDAALAGTGSEFVSGLLTTTQSHLKQSFNRYIDEQIGWFSGQTPAAKRAGVLSPLLKFPNFILKCESIVLPLKSSAADTSYQKMSLSLFRWLEGVAKTDDKYTDVLLVENAYYFYHTFTAAFPHQIAALQMPVEKAQQLYALHLSKYIAWQCEYELKEVYRFWARLEQAQAQMQRDEIQHARELGRKELRDLMRERCNGRVMNKSLVEIYKRVKKHLPRNDGMVSVVWGKVGEALLDKWRWFERSVRESYVDEKWTAATSGEVQDIINKINAAPPRVD